MESMPIILLFWMIAGIQDCDIKKIENYECKIFLDEDDDFTWENIDICGCEEERD